MSCCHGSGPGYASPAEAIKSEREKTLLVTSPHVANGPDAIFSIDVDPNSPNFMKVLSRVDMPNINDEVHHTGWNSCSSCHGDSSYKRTHLIVPCLYSDRVYIVDARDANDIKLEKTIEAEELHKHDVSFPHTSHCLADGNILISTLGNNEGDALGNFLLLDGKNVQCEGSLDVRGRFGAV
ncbi:unnamed protein product [Caenorhabditis auriculariae]|uniref:Selenium-binding protein n=1 Tax=Caenorhabditis auriculariae TaxID=2777116 RepID=A0A8S1HZQ6_9PELO|nr:unnamed protein product [Caenorhabditis auriculariae]